MNESLDLTGIYDDLKEIGLSRLSAQELINGQEPQAIHRALEMTKINMRKGHVTFPAGLFRTALEGGFVAPKS